MPHLSAPLFDLPDEIPYQGHSVEAQQASASGAVFSLEGRKAKTKRYLELLRFLGPVTDQQVQQLTYWPLSTVNSIRGTILKQAREAGLPAPIVPAGSEDVPRGLRGKKTTRTRWRLA